MLRNPFSFVLLLLVLLAGIEAQAGTRYWVAASDANWNNTANWSASSGGAGGSSVPSTNDTVFFDGNGPGGCTLNMSVSVQRVYVQSTYADTIIQSNGYTLSIIATWVSGGVPGWTQHAGTFIGGNEDFTVSSRFHLLGGSFTCPYNASRPVYSTFSGGFRYEGGTFEDNNGWISIGRGHTINVLVNSGRLVVSRLQIAMSSTGTPTYTVTSGQVIEVSDSLRIAGGSVAQTINTGMIEAKGVIQNTNTATGGGGTATILINGTGSQVLPGNGTPDQGCYPGISINKSSGTLTLTSTISVKGDWTYTAGALSPGSSRVYFSGTKTITGDHTLNKVTFLSGSVTFTIASGDTLTVNDTLAVTGSSTTAAAFNTGWIKAKGHITYAGVTGGTSGGTSSATMIICGTGDQSFTGSSVVSSGRVCNIEINKPSGTLNMSGYITAMGNWTYTAGALNAGTSTVLMALTKTITGSHTLYNFSMGGGSVTTIASGTTLTVDGTLSTVGTTATTVNTGAIHAKGDIRLDNSATNSTGGTATIVISGTGTQHFYGHANDLAGRVCNIEINKPSGTLYLHDNILAMQNWTYMAGLIDPGTSMVTIGQSRTVTGSHTLYSLRLGGGATITIASGTTVTASGPLIINGTTAMVVNTGTIHAKGDISITNTSTSTGGTATIVINGTGTQTLTGSGTNGAGALPHVTIDKASGTLNLSSTISCAGNWTYTQGTVDPGSSVVALMGTFNLDGQGTGGTMSFHQLATFSSGTRTLTGNVDVNNNFSISAGTTLAASSNTMNIGGNWNSSSGTFTAGTSTVVFDGRSYHKIIKTGATETFNNLTLNSTFDNASMTLNCPVKVGGTLAMTRGKMKTTSTNYLELLDNAIVTGGSDTAYVHGPVRKTGNDTCWFPLGDTTLTTGAYHPLRISAPSSTTDQFEAQYLASNPDPTYDIDSKEDTLMSVSNCEHWLLERKAGSSDVTVRAASNTKGSCIPGDFSDMRLAAWDANTSKWKDQGGAGLRITNGLVSVSSATNITLPYTPLPITPARQKNFTHYAILRRKLDGGYFHVNNGKLYFRFDEEYNDTDGKLMFNIYDADDNALVTSNTLTYSALIPNIAYGDNRCHINTLHCNVSPGGWLNNGFYILEVINEKNEKRYLRFKVANTISPLCTSNGTGGQ